jgi:hypothetical protein
MADGNVPGPIGTGTNNADTDDLTTPRTIFATPGPIGIGFEPEPLADQFVTKVTKDWDPTPKPDTAAIKMGGATLADLVANLAQLQEAGKGGGGLRADAPVVTSSDVTVALHGNLVNKVVDWTDFSTASAAAQAEFTRALGHLKKHEQRHMDIAVEEGNALATLLIGHKIGSKPSIADKVTAANTAMQKRQDDLDSPSESDHGRKAGHAFGDCNIDTSIK